MADQAELDELAFQAFELLNRTDQVLVLAESCTAGLIAATLARVPGMSARLAGSFVVYQISSKTEWLGLSAAFISQHDVVSREVAESMAARALMNTPHATIAMGITGHLGPDAPEGLDGTAWLGYAGRQQAGSSARLFLQTNAPTILQPQQRLFIRHERQQDAVRQSLRYLCERLEQIATGT